MNDFATYTIDEAPENSRPLLQAAKDNYKFVPNLLAVMAESPALLKGYMKLSEIFSNSSLNDAEQQIVLLSTSYVNKCHYCMAAHSVIADMFQVPSEVVNAIRDGKNINDPKLQALSKFTKQVVKTNGWPSEQDVNTFINAGYTRANIFEVILGIGLKTLSNYTNHIANTAVDDAFKSAAWEK